MASSGRAILLGKRKQEDEPFLRRHKDKETPEGFADCFQENEVRVKLLEKKSDETNLVVAMETVVGLDETSGFEEFLLLRKRRTVFVANLSHQTEISDIINFFEGVVYVRLILHQKGKHVGFVEFASVEEARKAVKRKNGKVLHNNKIIVYETPGFVEEAAEPKKTLFVAHFQTTDISDIIDFFKDVGEVVRVQLVLDSQGNLVGCGFVEFASANEAYKALQKKNGESLHDNEIYLDMADREATYLPPPRYCIDHKVWYQEDYLQLESPLLAEDAVAVEELDETSDHLAGTRANTLGCYVEDVLLIANLSPQTTEIMHIIHFFEDVGTVVSVRLIVNPEGKHVGFGFVEFASAYYAKKALEEKNGEYLHDHKILLMKGFDKTPDFVEAVSSVRSKTLFVDNLSSQTEISHIINFFKGVGKVVHVRLFVDHSSHLLGYGFIEFDSATEAKKVLENNKGEYLDDSEIILDVADNGAEYLRGQPMYCIDHKVWYKEDNAVSVEGLDETPDFSEEVAVREKTVFVDNIPNHVGMASLIRSVKFAGEVVRVRLIVDQWGERVGCCFIELPTAEAAKKAVEKKVSSGRSLNVAEIDPYPFLPKYNLADLFENLWYEDNLLRKHLPREIISNNKPDPWKQFCGKRTTTFAGEERS